MNSFNFTLRWKIFLLTLFSLFITVVFDFIIYILATSLIETEPFSKIIKWGINSIGSIPILIVLGGLVFVTSYTLLTNSIEKDLQKIHDTLQKMKEGNFQSNIFIHSHDELTHIAHQLNETARYLNQYLDEMINGLDQIAKGNISYEIPVIDDHKLGEVAISINQMAKHLSRSMQEERLAEQSKNDLITGVSHDLRTPLTSILGFLEVIKQNRYRDEVEIMHYVDIAYSKAEHLKRLIDNLFEFTRMNNGMPIKSEPLVLDRFLQQLLEEYLPIMTDENVTGRLMLKNHGVHISGDGELLVRAFANIIENAIKYGKDGKYIDIVLHTEYHKAIVTIVNYGQRIPASDLPFIFDRFYRVDKSRSLETGGTGLGLAISKSIIELHQGTIIAESDYHHTAFKLTFPLLENNSKPH